MESGFTVNPTSAVVFTAIGIGVWFFSREKSWLLSRPLSRSPVSLGIFCAVLPFPFLFVFLWDMYRHGRSEDRTGDA
ncbi:MAG: hypothetical protein ACRCXL_04775 [Dermatophilaceae bacterium]